MTILIGPQFSLEARNKFGGAMVYFTWKGRNVCRALTKPTNPRDIDQKIARQTFAAMGKNIPKINRPATGLLDGSKMYQMLKDGAPATQIWNANFVGECLGSLNTDALFTAFSAAIFGCGDTEPEWFCAATTLGIETLTGVEYATTIAPSLILAMGGYAASKMSLSSVTDIYSIAPEEWTTDMILHFQEDYQTTA